jgi:hypothetical protein
MKKLMIRISGTLLAFVIALGVIAGGLVAKGEASAKSIYFAGKYRHSKYGMSLSMSAYTEKSKYKKGEECGTFILKPDIHTYYKIKGAIKKIGNNKYQWKKNKSKIIFKIYKKKVIVKCNWKPEFRGEPDYNGIYKLKKHYYS